MSLKKVYLISVLLALFTLPSTAQAQSDAVTGNGYRNFPIVVTLQFHNLALPFHDIKSSFKNIGIGIGTEISLNGDHNWAQEFNVIWFRNKVAGNGLLFYTQSAWRPMIVSKWYMGIKAGVGYLYAFRPTESFRPVEDGWVSTGRKGKGMLALPAGLSLGYHDFSERGYMSPFVSYQMMLVSGYNSTIPVMPETLLQIGTGIHPAYK